MSWLISLMLAGVVFSSDVNLPAAKPSGFANGGETKKVVRLDETERFEQTYPLSPNGRVSVSNVNGSITIETWDRSEVKLEAVKTADDKNRLADVEIRIDAQKDALSIETDYDNWKRDSGNRGWRNDGKLTVDYRLTVPKGAVLDEIETVNGSVTITNAANRTKASAVNGQVIATNLRGTANLSTVNGTVEASFDELSAASRITLETVNGQVNLTVPSDVNATLRADTVNGSINNDFGLPVRKGQYVGRDLYGRIGSGEVQIRLNSVNGPLNIKRKNDGRNVNPATNLLPQKNGADDADWDDDKDDQDSLVKPNKINKEVNKAVKNSQKDVAAQMKNAQKEMEQAQKEMEKINQVEIQNRIEEGMRRQKEAMARVMDAGFLNGAPVIEKKNESFPVKGTPKVTVDARNCAVTVRGWDKPEVEYSITRLSRGRDPKPLDYTVDHSDSEVKIIVAGKNSGGDVFFNEAERVRVEVFVPKKSNLSIRTDREIRLENVTGEIDLKGGDESINVRDVGGRLSVASADGRIRVIGFRGELTTTTGDGETSLEGDFDKLTATTGDGTIILTLPDDASATIRSNTEDVNLDALPSGRVTTVSSTDEGPVWRIGDGRAVYNFRVSEGQVVIRPLSELKAGL
ncbi:MAG: DUF4097 family beta strand repeat protein [Acidobacteria bacterium]|nr:DUF4097 family beta strand repeat protein [Acidobacteriota bacterium]